MANRPATQPDSRSTTAGVSAVVERFTGLTSTGQVVLAGSLGGFGLARVLGGQALYLLVDAGFAVVVSAVVVSRRTRRVEAERSELPVRMRVGQSAEVEVTVRAPGRLRAFVLQEHLSELLCDPVRVPVASVGGADEFVHRYTIRPALRGVYRLGPLAAEWIDPFGLARHQQALIDPIDVIVHPSTEPVFDRPLTRMWEDPPFRPPVSKPWPQGGEFYGMRDYVTGDDPRRIVWTATGRTGRLLVREAEQGITDRISIVIDNQRRGHSPGDPSDTFELAVRAVASLGAHSLHEGYSVRLASNDAVLGRELRGDKARMGMLDQLARLEFTDAPLQDAIERIVGERLGGNHLCVVSTGFDGQTASRLKLLTDKGMSLVVALIKWDDSDPNAFRRARQIGAQVVQVAPGQQLEAAFVHAVGVSTR